ncbi:hypothetical protein KC338_g88 [Hortaea werneckii]|nr:hypothetical protein KC338_g88 [Hortaea werneckii]
MSPNLPHFPNPMSIVPSSAARPAQLPQLPSKHDSMPTTSMASDPRNVHFRFLELPRELRDCIYDLLYQKPRSELLEKPYGYQVIAFPWSYRCHLFQGVHLDLCLDGGMGLQSLKFIVPAILPGLRAININSWRTHNRKKCDAWSGSWCESSINIGISTDLEPFTYNNGGCDCLCPDYEDSFEQAESLVRGLETKLGKRQLTPSKLRQLLKILTRPWNFNSGRTYLNNQNLWDEYLRVRRLERLGKSKRLIARHKEKILSCFSSSSSLSASSSSSSPVSSGSSPESSSELSGSSPAASTSSITLESCLRLPANSTAALNLSGRTMLPIMPPGVSVSSCISNINLPPRRSRALPDSS